MRDEELVDLCVEEEGRKVSFCEIGFFEKRNILSVVLHAVTRIFKGKWARIYLLGRELHVS